MNDRLKVFKLAVETYKMTNELNEELANKAYAFAQECFKNLTAEEQDFLRVVSGDAEVVEIIYS